MKPIAIIVDIDGTLAHLNGRSPYDPTKYMTDTVDEVVRELTWLYGAQDYSIIICSGRDETYRDVTEKWLQYNNIYYDELFMRDAALKNKQGNKLEDSLVKKKIYLEQIKPKYDICLVVDDRNRVVEMWRSMGLKVLQVADGAF